jgi:hypothetical protein
MTDSTIVSTDRPDALVQLQRLEGLALGLAALALYAGTGASWGLFALLLLAPDLSMVGYLGGPWLGALCYNLGHSLLGPLLLAGLGWALALPLVLSLGLIWLAHVGLDRALGYGLKRASHFRETHLGRL